MNRFASELSFANLRHLSNLRRAFDGQFVSDDVGSAAPVIGRWAPRVDIREEDHRFVILADVPGIDPATIDVSMDGNVLSIRGERAGEGIESSGKYTRVERAHGRFDRRFVLPDSADAEGITAHGKHGVLEIVIPKRAQSAPRRITIDTTH